MPETCQVEIWVVVDEEGNAGLGCSPNEATEAYQEGGYDEDMPTRTIKLNVIVPLPIATELEVVVPVQSETVTVES